MKINLLNSKQTAVINQRDFRKASKLKWRLASCGYVRSGSIYLHRLVMNAKPGEEVDHRNRNPLDCRRGNLRFVSRIQNCHNSGKKASKTGKYPTSLFKGVWKCKTTGLFCASIKLPSGKRKWLGRHVSEIKAARVYNSEALKAFGNFAFQNNIL